MAILRPDDLPAAASVTETGVFVVDTGATVEKATAAQIVDSAIPLASQAEAEAGTDNAKRVTPLRVAQAIDALGVSASVLSSNASGDGAARVGIVTGGTVQDAADAYGLPSAYIAQGGADVGEAFDSYLDEIVATSHPGILEGGSAYSLDTWSRKTLSAELKLRGNGGTVTGPGDGTDFATPDAGFDIEDTGFAAWGAVLERLTADGGSVDNARFVNSRIDNPSSVAINIEVASENLLVTHSLFADSTFGYCVRVGTNTYASQDDWRGATLAFSRFDGITGTDDKCAPFVLYGKDHLVLGTRNYDTAGSGTVAIGGYLKARHSTVAFHVSDGITASGGVAANRDVTGFTWKGSLRGDTSSPQGYGSLLLGIVAKNIGVNGSYGKGIRVQTGEVQIAHSFTEDTGLDGYTIDDPSGHMVSAVHCRARFSSPTSTVGFRVTQGGYGAGLVWPVVDGAGTGILLGDGGGDVAENMYVDGGFLNIGAGGTGIITSGSGTIEGIYVRNVIQRGGATFFTSNTDTKSDVRLLDNVVPGNINFNTGTMPGDLEIRHQWTETTTDGSVNNAMILTLPDNCSYMVEAKIVGVEAGGGNRAMYHKEGLIYRDGGSATVQGTIADVVTPIETDAAWDGLVLVSGNFLIVRVVGKAATTVNWKLWVHLIGVQG